MPTELNNMYLASGGKLALAFGTSASKIYGSVDADTVTIAAGVTAVLDGSFNRGNDIIQFTGNAASYSIVKVNASTVKITDAAGTSVTIPVGSTGTHIQFADADRVLSGSSAGIVLGDQSVTSTAVSLAAGAAPAPVEAYTLSVNAPTVTEGDTGSKTMSYKLTLDKAPTSTVTVNYETLDTGSATANDDFVPAAGSVTFAAGQTVAFVSVTVLGDTIVEVPETIKLNLSGSKLVASVEATGTIVDNETATVDPTSYTVTAGQIATADAQQVPVTVNVGDTGNKTVTIQSDADSADKGVIINGNATVSVTAGAAGDKISVSGNANNTIDAGTGTSVDEVNVYGSGNNTIYVGAGNDKVEGGTGNDSIYGGAGNDELNGGAGNDTIEGGAGDDTINGGAGNDTLVVRNGDTLDANQNALSESYDGGDGTDTLAVYGDNNFTNSTLTSIEIIEINSDVVFTTTQVEGVTTFRVNPAATTATHSLTIVKDGANTEIDLSGKLSGVTSLTLGQDVVVTVSTSDLAALTAVTVGNNASFVTTIAGAQALLALNPAVTYTIADTQAAIAAAQNDPALAAVVDGALGIAAGATNPSIETALSLDLAGKGANYEYAVDASTDEAFNQLYLDGAAATQLSDSNATVNLTGTATVAQAVTFQNELADIGITYAISDTAANIAAQIKEVQTFTLSAADGTGGTFKVSNVTVTAAASATETAVAAAAKAALDAAITANNADVANIESVAVSGAALKITFKASAQNVGQVTFADVNSGVTRGAVVESQSAPWLNASDVSSLTIVGDMDVATALHIFNANGALKAAVAEAAASSTDTKVITLPAYSIKDSATDVANALGDAASKVVVKGAASVSLNSSATVQQATELRTELGAKLASYNLTGDAATLFTAASAVVDGAKNITVTGDATVTQMVRIDGYKNSGTLTYNLKDSGAQLAGAATTILAGATTVSLTGASATDRDLTVVQLKKLEPYLAKNDQFELVDDAANLSSPDGLALIAKFTHLTVTASDALTLDQAKNVKAAVGANATLTAYAISEDATSMLAKVNASQTDALGNASTQTTAASAYEALIDAAITAGKTVTAVGGISISDVAKLLDTDIGNPGIKYSISDTAEKVAANAGSFVAGAQSVTLTGPAATATEAVAIYNLSVTRTAASKSAISFAIRDDLDNIAAQVASRAALEAATSITVVDSVVNVAAARNIAIINTDLTAASKAKLAYAISDAVGNFPTSDSSQADVNLLSGATSVKMTGTAADIKAYAEATATDGLFAKVNGYTIEVTYGDGNADLDDDIANATYYNNAQAICITDTVDVEAAERVYNGYVSSAAVATNATLIANKGKVEFDLISDSADALVGAKGDVEKTAALGQAAKVTIGSGTPTVQDVKDIDALVAGTLDINVAVTDTVANLLTLGSLVSSLNKANSGSISATDKASVADYATLLASIRTVADMNVDIVDSITAVQSASVEVLSSLGVAPTGNTITLSGGSEVALTVAQKSVLTTAGGTTLDGVFASNGFEASYQIVDTATNVINRMAANNNLGEHLSDATKIVVTGGVTIPNDYFGHLKTLVAAANFDKVNSNFSVSGDVATLYNSNDAASLAVIEAASSVTVTDAVTLTSGGDLLAKNTNITFASLEGNLAGLTTGTVAGGDLSLRPGVADIAAKSVKVVVTDTPLSAVDAKALAALFGSSVTVQFDISGSAADLIAAGSLLASAKDSADADSYDIIVTGTAKISELDQLQALAKAGAKIDYALQDTASQLALATEADLDGASTITVSTGSKATVAEAIAIETKADAAVVLNVVGTADEVVSNLTALATAGVDTGSDSITLSTTVNAAQAKALADSAFTVNTAKAAAGTAADVASKVYLVDTAENLLAASNASAFTNAAKVTVDGAIDVAKAVRIADAFNDNNTPIATQSAALAAMKYTVADNLTFIVAAFAEDNAVLGNALSVTVTGVGTIKVERELGGNGNYYLVGTVQELQALPADLLAVGYIIKDTVANYLSAGTFATADAAQGYVLVDKADALLATSSSVVVGASEVQVTDSVNAQKLADIQLLTGTKLTNVAEVSDSAAKLAASDLDATGLVIGLVKLTDASVTESAARGVGDTNNGLLAVNSSYVLSENASNIDFDSTGGYADQTLIEKAQSVTITGTALNVANAGLIETWNANNTISVQDNAAALGVLTVVNPDTAQQKQIAALQGAASVKLDANQVVSVELAKALLQLPGFDGKFTLHDTAENLFAADDALLASAEKVTVNGTATYEQAVKLSALSNIETEEYNSVTYAKFDIQDSAVNIAGGSDAVLSKVTGITFTSNNNVSASQAQSLKVLDGKASVIGLDLTADVMDVVDNATNITNTLYKTGVQSADTVTVVGGAISVAQAASIVALNADSDFSLIGTRSQLQAAPAAVITALTTNGTAGKVTVTDEVTAAQASVINNIYSSAQSVTFNGGVSGSLAQLSDALIAQTSQVVLTSKLTVVEARAFLDRVGSKLVGGYDIQDSVANIVNAKLNDVYDAAIISGADTVSLLNGSNTMNIAEAEVVIDTRFTGAYNIADTAEHISNAAPSIVNGATATTVTFDDNVAETFDASGFTAPVTLNLDGLNAGVDILTLATAGTKAGIKQTVDVTGSDAFTLKFGYLQGTTFVEDAGITDYIQVTAGGKTVIIDGTPNFKLDSTYVFAGTADDETIRIGSVTVNNVTTGFGAIAGDKVYAFGGAGDDVIISGLSTDTMVGGAGSDKFAFTAGSSTAAALDTILDFDNVVDVLDLSGYANAVSVAGAGATTTAAATDVMVVLGGKVTFNAADNTLGEKLIALAADTTDVALGEAVFFEDSGNTYIFVNGATDDLICLSNVTGLTTLTAASGVFTFG